jgi:hypothetical protein
MGPDVRLRAEVHRGAELRLGARAQLVGRIRLPEDVRMAGREHDDHLDPAIGAIAVRVSVSGDRERLVAGERHHEWRNGEECRERFIGRRAASADVQGKGFARAANSIDRALTLEEIRRRHRHRRRWERARLIGRRW